MEIRQLEKRMKSIRPGDVIHFNSVGACRVPGDMGRNISMAIPADGTVEHVYPRYVLVSLGRVRECVLWDGIVAVNGRPWPLYREGKAS